MARPIIAGGIFADRIRPPIGNAERIALITAARCTRRGAIEAVTVAYGEAGRAHFAAGNDPGTTLVQGSITRFADHGCDAIANAANMEVRFGGGISGIIGRATGESAAIEGETVVAIGEFWGRNETSRIAVCDGTGLRVGNLVNHR